MASDPFEPLIGDSPPLRELIAKARLAAACDVSVLIRGESGTGKELIARALHDASARAEGPFVAAHCAALPSTLLESELFGHAAGAFTGAISDRAGLFEAAEGGTLLLDEVGEIPLETQVKLLRVLQQREVVRVGENTPRPIDVRLLTATHRDLRALVGAGRVREDFYYRVRVYELLAPPLRERREDIESLATAFVEQLAREWGKPVEGVAAEALAKLLAHEWPGNIRELRNAIEHAFVTVAGPLIQPRDLPPEIGELVAGAPPEDCERRQIIDALEATGWNRTEAAKRLGISRVTLWKRIRKHRIDQGLFHASSDTTPGSAQ